MSALSQPCSICGNDFDLELNYQMEERASMGADGTPDARFVFFCSERCYDEGRDTGPPSGARCDACGASFAPTKTSTVPVRGADDPLACGVACRAQLLAEARGARLGSIKMPSERPGPVDPPRVIAVFNHKGGTGKTTTAVNVAAGLANTGHRVLLVDADAQGSVAASLGLSVDRSLYHIVVLGLRIEEVALALDPHLDVVPSNETLAAAELYLVGRRRRDRVLLERMAHVHEQYDYVVVDCSPSLSLMNQNVLAFADSVLCPVACDYLSMVGVRQVLKTIRNVNVQLGHPVKLLGVLPTLYDERVSICREALDTLREEFGARCFNPIRAAVAAKEAPAIGATLFEYAPEAKVTTDYLAVVDRLTETQDFRGHIAMPA